MCSSDKFNVTKIINFLGLWIGFGHNLIVYLQGGHGPVQIYYFFKKGLYILNVFTVIKFNLKHFVFVFSSNDKDIGNF